MRNTHRTQELLFEFNIQKVGENIIFPRICIWNGWSISLSTFYDILVWLDYEYKLYFLSIIFIERQ